MDTYKLKIKIGDHEFEAEGPTEAVERQFEAFKQIVTASPAKTETKDAGGNGGSTQSEREPLVKPPAGSGSLNFDAIFKTEGRLVSLSVLPKSDEETGFLIVLGQKLYRSNEMVTGAEILDGIERTSGHAIERADQLLREYVADGMLIKTGSRRGIRYRLSNKGLAASEALAKEYLATVA